MLGAHHRIGLLVFALVVLAFGGCGSDPIVPADPPEPWVRQESGTLADLFDVCFVDSVTGTAVGAAGVILRTTDGGATWSRQESGTRVGLSGVAFFDASIGTVVGEDSTILRTDDGGATWHVQLCSHAGNPFWFYAVSMSSESTCTVVGDRGAILRTTDRGANWVEQSSGETRRNLRDVCFAGMNTGTAVGAEGLILRTTDGGATWTRQESGTGKDLWSVDFIDAHTGTAAGYLGLILRTTDGGATWVHQFEGALGAFATIRGVSLVDRDLSFAVGQNVVFRTDDGGATWGHRRGPDAPPFGYLGVSFTDAHTGTIVGSGGTILRTTSGGR
jgi:photosystem II stability/assembly factor-like uncharacterized protein